MGFGLRFLGICVSGCFLCTASALPIVCIVVPFLELPYRILNIKLVNLVIID